MSLFAFAPSRGPRWPLAMQAALGIGVPIAVMTLLGQPSLGYIAASGAFTVLFVGSAPAVDRARILPLVAAGLILSAAFGVLLSADPWLVSAGVVVVAIASAALTFGFRLGPPGPLFFILLFGLSGHVVDVSSIAPGVYLAALAAGCAFSYLVAMVPLLLPRARTTPARPLHELLPGPSLGTASRILMLRVAIVAVIGVLLGLLIDPARTYWIVGSAVAVVGVAAARREAFQRGLHRMLGTVIGAGVYALLALLHPSGLWLALLLAALQFTIELVVVRHYALALVFITPLVLMLTGAATGEIGAMDVAAERIVDTVVGAALGAASGLLHPRAMPESPENPLGRVDSSAQNGSVPAVIEPPRPADILEYHRKLAPEDREICELLATEIERGLPEAESKVWHAHPVWFLDGNPIVGYDRLKDAVRLMFWSGQSFDVAGLAASGSFQAAEARFTDVDDIDTENLAKWLSASRDIQWDYEHIRTNRGLVKRTAF